MPEKKLTARMFGGFNVTFCDTLIVSEGARVTKAMTLLQYLLVNRERIVTQDELMRVLLDEDESDNPANALKNIVYRLRKMFDGEGFEDEEIVIFKKNNYHLNDEYTYETDIESFTSLIKQADSENLSEKEKFDTLMQAIKLYRGEFLPKESGDMWVIPISVELQNRYIDSLEKAYRICETTGEYDEIFDSLNKAASMYPYEENLQAMRIGCYVGKKQFEKAAGEYESVCGMLLDELGVTPGEQLLSVYRKLAETDRPPEESIKEVRSDISEREFDSGAFFSNIQAFKTTYRFVVRNFERNGMSVFLILCTLRGADGAMLKRGDQLTKASQTFYEAAKMSMRRGDLYTRYNPSQFLIMLTNITQENCKVVIGRIEKNFFKMVGKLDAALNCQIISAVDIDSIMNTGASSEGRLSWNV